ncbi:MAG: hypothetical protein AMXMBFR84_05990 [Candidatus Hydrogenedentota bacterium]
MISSRSQSVLWGLAAVLVVGFAVTATILSLQFTYGEGHAQRPLLLYCTVHAAGWLGMALAGWLAVRHSKGSFPLILFAGVTARCILVLSQPMEDDSMYRYLLDGHMARAGVNPYSLSPEAVQLDPPAPLTSMINSDPAQQIISRVAYPEMKSPHAPLAVAAFSAGSLMTPWQWHGQRIVFLLADMGTWGLILMVLRLIERPLAWSVLYAWNPLVLKEAVNTPHPDVFAALLIIAAILCARRWTEHENPLWAGACGIAVAAATLATYYPIIVAPAFLAVLFRGEHRFRAVAAFVLPLAIWTAVGTIPFVQQLGMSGMLEGLRTQTAHWRTNDGAFSFVSWLAETRAMDGLAQWSENLPIMDPGAAVMGREQIPALARLLALAIVALTAVGTAAMLYFFGETGDDFLWAIRSSLLVLWLMAPAPFPWMAIPILALGALSPTISSLALSFVAIAYYALACGTYHGWTPAVSQGVKFAEHGLIWAAIAAPIVVMRRRATAPPDEPAE